MSLSTELSTLKSQLVVRVAELKGACEELQSAETSLAILDEIEILINKIDTTNTTTTNPEPTTSEPVEVDVSDLLAMKQEFIATHGVSPHFDD